MLINKINDKNQLSDLLNSLVWSNKELSIELFQANDKREKNIIYGILFSYDSFFMKIFYIFGGWNFVVNKKRPQKFRINYYCVDDYYKNLYSSGVVWCENVLYFKTIKFLINTK